MEDNVAQQVVAARFVPTATANQRMVTEAIQHPTTARALDILVGEEHA